jgi:outer membrane protein assembly factor BamB
MAYADGIIYVAVGNMYIDVTPSTYTPGDISQTSGEMVAIDAGTGKILWDKKFPALDIGAATVVNDLVFTGTLDGKIYALKRDTGDIVRTLEGAPGINGWAAVSKDTIVMLGGSNGNPAVVAFKLGAPQPSAVPSPTASSMASPSLTPTPSASTTP